MCGICGVFNDRIKRIEKASVLNMCAAMEHRGPDDLGLWDSESVLLGHRRLSIIDLATGQQPMQNEDGTIVVVLNGEIYNFHALRKELINKGHVLKSASDTEVLVHLYEDEGVGMLHRLRGMFSFALWDDRAKKLICARDRTGQKPFYYSYKNSHFVFSSELGSLFAEGSIEKRIDKKALYYYLTYGYIPHPITMYEGVFKLPPAHYVIVQNNNVVIEKYWSLDAARVEVPRSQRAIEKRLYALLSESTKLRMISDVPLGAFLSGGLDSSCVVALMSALSNAPIKTFSIGFEDPQYNELPYAKKVAEKFGTDHTEFMVNPAMTDVLPELVRRFGEPFADSSCLPTYYVSKLTREYVTVALNGDGADESFAGYGRYYAIVLSEYLAKFFSVVPEKTWDLFVNKLPAYGDQRAFMFRMRRFLSGIKKPVAKRYKRWVSSFDESDFKLLLKPSVYDVYAAEASNDSLIDLFSSISTNNMLQKLLGVDIHSYLPGDLLVKMDISSMMNSLETRSPFLDHKVMEFMWALPVQYKLRGMTSKYILKKAFRSVLPKEILRRKKTGFGVPVCKWFRNELKDYVKEVLLDQGGFACQYFDSAQVEKMITDHVAGVWNHDRSLWTLLMLELWYRYCFK